ncbi:MAG: hypothetical protein Harvfovirus1_95, partial [Harvfovirus sp.]
LFEILEINNAPCKPNDYKMIDIMKAVEKIDDNCILMCYKYGITVMPSLHKNNAPTIEHLRTACLGDNLVLIKKISKEYKMQLDEQCLENACTSGHNKIIDFIVKKCGIKITERCILNYANRNGNVFMKKLFTYME